MIRGEVTIRSSRRAGDVASRDQGRCAQWLLWLALSAATCLCLQPLTGIQAQSTKNAVDRDLDKYKLIRTLGLYCNWPDESFGTTQGTFVIAILGNEANPKLADAYFQRHSPRVKDRKLVIQRIQSLQDLPPCQILYLTDAVSPEIARDAVKTLREKPVLIVGDAPQFAESGGCTAFDQDETGAVRIKINAAEVRARKIGMDVRMSKLAVTVETRQAIRKPP